MGACCCCCASKPAEIANSSPFYHYPRVSEEQEPLSSHQGTASVLATGLLVDTNLDTSIPDTYRPPPAPIPYETLAGRPRTPPGIREIRGNKAEAAVQPINSESVGGANSVCNSEASAKNLKESDNKVQADIELSGSKEVDDDIEKSKELIKSSQPVVLTIEECPTCLEEYDEENPKMMTKCDHHFHLACILEWLERSDTCPVCGQEMVFDASVDA